MNLGIAVGDAPERVAANRARFAAACGAAPVFLRQVHGTRVVRIGAGRRPARGAGRTRPTPASRPSRASPARCRSPTACRCCSPRPAGGASPPPMPAGAASPPACSKRPSPACARRRIAGRGELDAWLGVCIGPARLRGRRRRARSVRRPLPAGRTTRRFVPAQPGKWLADLAGLARDRLAAAGVERVSAAAGCAFEDASRFFSYRRDRVTGRMAAAVWIDARRGPRLRRARRGGGRGAAPACPAGRARCRAAGRRRAGR